MTLANLFNGQLDVGMPLPQTLSLLWLFVASAIAVITASMVAGGIYRGAGVSFFGILVGPQLCLAGAFLLFGLFGMTLVTVAIGLLILGIVFAVATRNKGRA